MTAEERLQAARLKAVFTYRYLATALMALIPVRARGLGTFAVSDRWHLYWDDVGWTVDQTAEVLAHEVWHLLRKHSKRAKAKGVTAATEGIAQIATDCEINDSLELSRLPGSPMLPESFDLEPHMLWESYYDELLRRPPDEWDLSPPSVSSGSCATGVQKTWETCTGGVSDLRSELLARKTAHEVLEKSCGDTPLGVKRWAESILSPVIPWERVLRGCLRATLASVAGMVDYSYARPSRRQSVSGDIIFPSLRAPSPKVSVVVDTSGSMMEEELARALVEVGGLLNSMRCSITVMSVDAEVHVVQQAFRPDQIDLLGGGGTDMRVGIRECLRRETDIIVVFTDGYTPWPERPPGVPVIVVLIGSEEQPPSWARTVRVAVDEVEA